MSFPGLDYILKVHDYSRFSKTLGTRGCAIYIVYDIITVVLMMCKLTLSGMSLAL